MTIVRSLALAMLLTACGGGETADGEGGAASGDLATQTAAIAKKVKANPDNAEAILKEAGMSEADLEKAMYDIAKDPALSKAYAEAMK